MWVRVQVGFAFSLSLFIVPAVLCERVACDFSSVFLDAPFIGDVKNLGPGSVIKVSREINGKTIQDEFRVVKVFPSQSGKVTAYSLTHVKTGKEYVMEAIDDPNADFAIQSFDSIPDYIPVTTTQRPRVSSRQNSRADSPRTDFQQGTARLNPAPQGRSVVSIGGKQTIVDGPNAEMISKLLEKNNLNFDRSIKIGDTTIRLTKTFDAEGRKVALMIVENKNGRYLRTVYQSGSGGNYRVLPAYNDVDSNGFFPGSTKRTPVFWKPPNEEDLLTLPESVQKVLRNDFPHATVPEGDAQVLFRDSVTVNRSLEDYNTHNTENAFLRETFSQKNGVMIVGSRPKLKRKVGPPLSHPKDIGFKYAEDAPDFSRGPVSRVQQEIKGEKNKLFVEVEVYQSKNGRFNFTIMRDKLNRAWVSAAEPADSELNSFGVPRENVDFGDLLSPLWEYSDQIADEFKKSERTRGANYLLNWDYVREIPLIQDYYQGLQAQGRNITMPPGTTP
jgi:hypothetical protein